MSPIDPLQARTTDDRDDRGRGSARALAVIFGLCALAAAALAGFAAAAMFDQFRVMSINSVFGNWDTTIPVAVRGLGLPVGILATMGFLALYGKWNRRGAARDVLSPAVAPFTIVLLGLTIGTWIATTMWTEPDAVGVAVDPTFSEHAPWDAGAWILYTAKWWLPGLLTLFTVVSVGGRLAARRRFAARTS